MFLLSEKYLSKPIKVWVSPSFVKKKVGMTITFLCEVDHYREDYTIRWTFYGLPLPSNGEVVNGMVLTVRNLTLKNSGAYVCVAKSGLQQAAAVGRILVMGKSLLVQVVS